MSNVLRWVLLLPAAFISYALTGYIIAFIMGRTLGKLEFIPFEIRLRFEWLAFFTAGFVFVFVGKSIAPDYELISAIILFIMMLIVNITSPARKDCRVVQVIGSFIAILVNFNYNFLI
jgi:uncharacterized membrane protein YjjP (DUF1212 family)